MPQPEKYSSAESRNCGLQVPSPTGSATICASKRDPPTSCGSRRISISASTGHVLSPLLGYAELYTRYRSPRKVKLCHFETRTPLTADEDRVRLRSRASLNDRQGLSVLTLFGRDYLGRTG